MLGAGLTESCDSFDVGAGGKHNAYEGGVRSTAWISGGPLDKAVVAAGGVAPSASQAQDTYSGLMHAVDWVETLAHVAGYTATPKTKGIVLDGMSQWHSLITNSTSPRKSVHLPPISSFSACLRCRDRESARCDCSGRAGY